MTITKRRQEYWREAYSVKIFIAICDDEVAVTGELETKLEEMLDGMNLKYEIDVYLSGVELMKAIESGQYFDLIFLDIEFAMGEINGVEVGKLIRDTFGNNEVSIVYISREKKYHDELLSLQVLDFLHKPINYAKVDKILRKYMDIAGIRSSTISYKIMKTTYKIKVSDVMYVESVKRNLIIHHKNGEQFEFYGALKDYYPKQLSKYDFIYISSSYAVNYDFIAEYNYETIKLHGIKASFSISQDRRKDVRAKCLAIENRKDV